MRLRANAVPGRPRRGATCRCPAPPRSSPQTHHQLSPASSIASVVRFPRRDQPAASSQCATPRSGFLLCCAAAPPRPVTAGDALEFLSPEVLKLEQIAKKPARPLSDDHRIRFCDALQTRRKVWCLADNATFLRLTRSNQIADYDHPCRNAHAGLQRNGGIEGRTAPISSSPALTARSASSSWACG